MPPFSWVTNPRWKNFLDLFRSIDKGNPQSGIAPYNGGLFHKDDNVDNLELNDEWTDYFKEIGDYDFRDEVNVDVLGHLFERSVNDIERIRVGGLFKEEFDEEIDESDRPSMDRSAERKRFGIFYTPPDFTSFITKKTVAAIIEARFESIAEKRDLEPTRFRSSKPDPVLTEYWRECLEAIRRIKIVDPACGSGAFLIQTYDVLDVFYQDIIDHLIFNDGDENETLRDNIPDYILHDNIYGVDLSPEAVEITQLALWIRSAHKGRSLADLSHNIVCGNSLVSNPETDPHALDWKKTFPEIFNRESPGFDCVIGNPPWERMKLQEREFFDRLRPEIAAAVNAADRRERIGALEKSDPGLYRRYIEKKPMPKKHSTMFAGPADSRLPA